MEKLPDRGIYLLLILLSEDMGINVGSLGMIEFKRGYYVYVGTAQKNLRKRVERHLKSEKKVRWHVDYLLDHAWVEDVVAIEAPREWEERVALKLSHIYPHIPRFGASDTSAPSHLFYVGSREEWKNVVEILKEIK